MQHAIIGRGIAAVKFRSGRSTVCAASLHCCKSEGTADLLGALKDVLEGVVGEAFVIVGLDSNVPGEKAGEFQSMLRTKGIHFGDNPEAQQVTVAKTRTAFQTQVLKAGETDVSHKDYVLTWGPGQRQATAYTPDLCTPFGIDRNQRGIFDSERVRYVWCRHRQNGFGTVKMVSSSNRKKWCLSLIGLRHVREHFLGL